MHAPDAADPRWSLELAGGALMELGCYGLHVMRMLGGWLGADTYSFTLRVAGTLGEAIARNFLRPHEDDRVIVDTLAGTRVERLGTRASYTNQLQGFVAHVVDGCPLPIDATDAVQNMEYVDSA